MSEEEADAETSLSDAMKSASINIVIEKPSYGFNDAHSGVLNALLQGHPDLMDIRDPDNVPNGRRQMLRMAAEDDDFDIDRFIADELAGDDDPINIAANEFLPHWATGFNAGKVGSEPSSSAAPSFNFCSGDDDLVFTFGSLSVDKTKEEEVAQDVAFSAEERATMLALPNKEYLLEEASAEGRAALRSILCVVLAYVYDHRMTQGDPSIESAWTVRKLSATLSWLDTCTTTRAVIETFVHRCLTYPYMRSFKLAKKCAKDAGQIFTGGRRVVLRCLLQVRQIFASSDEFYSLNRLFVDDMCVWLQTVSEITISELAKDISRAASSVAIRRIRWGLASVLRAEAAQKNE